MVLELFFFLTVSLIVLEVVVKILVLGITSLFSDVVDGALEGRFMDFVFFYCYKFVCCRWYLIFFQTCGLLSINKI